MSNTSKRYRLYIDEAGDHVYSQDENNVVSLYLGITGVIFDVDHYRDFIHPNFIEFKQKHFSHSPDEPVIFHRKELINKSGSFWQLMDPVRENSFNTELLQALNEYDFKVLTVVIDKYAHLQKHGEFAPHPYHYGVAALLELYSNFLNRFHAKGDVLAESRGTREDMQLKEAYKSTFSLFRNILTTDEIKIQPKSANITGLQIADLLAYPCRAELLYLEGRVENRGGTYGQRICQTIRNKQEALFLG